MKEERFSAFRLHKEHKGIIFLFGIFALLFSAFYLSLLVDWKPKGAAELGKFAACVGLIYMAPGLMCSLLGGILLAGQKKRGSSAVPEESVHRRNGIRSGKNSLKAAWDMR